MTKPKRETSLTVRRIKKPKGSLNQHGRRKNMTV